MLFRRSIPLSTAAIHGHSKFRTDLQSTRLDSKRSNTQEHMDDHARENDQCRKFSRAAICMHLFTLRELSITTVGFLAFISSFSILCLLQFYAFVFEFQGPLDHVAAIALWKPYYAMYCPAFSIPNDMQMHSEKINSGSRRWKSGDSFVATSSSDFDSLGISWDCNSVAGINASSQIFPQIFMIGARDKQENTFRQWKQIIQHSHENANISESDAGINGAPRLHRINTLKISNQYAISGGAIVGSHSKQSSSSLQVQNEFLCRSMKWEQRLFAVYQSVFAKLLSSFPKEQDFVVVEDDAVLLKPNALIEEVCHARFHRLEFYSLYRSPLQWKGKRSVSCIYQHGTVAFYIQRSLMETIVKENRRGWFCRFPIDMYISKLGPWYATRREIVGHLDGGRVGSTG
ncbi:hypothetical protein ACHAW6_012783 [Cyclotella cf. meneghiniana]